MAYLPNLGANHKTQVKTKVPYSLNWTELLNRQLVVMGDDLLWRVEALGREKIDSYIRMMGKQPLTCGSQK